MDPNATLRAIRACVRAMLDPRTSAPDRDDEGHNLVEHVVDLDAWLAQGGFLPEAWARARHEGEPLAPLLAEVVDLATREVDARLPADELARRLEQVKATAAEEDSAPTSLGADQGDEPESRPAL